METKQAVMNLLGSRVLCTLSDGRTAEGTLVCVDRCRNMILMDCQESREIHSSDYNYKSNSNSSINNNKTVKDVTHIAKRHLQQAMIPGTHLVRVQIHARDYETKVKPYVSG